MVLRSAQYMRHNDMEEAESGPLGGGSSSSQRSNSLVNSNSISLTEAAVPAAGDASLTQQLSAAGAANVSAAAAGEEDSMSVSSDRLCTAPDGGHVRFVNSTIRYHMNGPGFWQARSKLEKGLMVGLLTLAGTIVVLMFVIIGYTDEVNTLNLHLSTSQTDLHHGTEYCLSPECVKVAGNTST